MFQFANVHYYAYLVSPILGFTFQVSLPHRQWYFSSLMIIVYIALKNQSRIFGQMFIQCNDSCKVWHDHDDVSIFCLLFVWTTWTQKRDAQVGHTINNNLNIFHISFHLWTQYMCPELTREFLSSKFKAHNNNHASIWYGQTPSRKQCWNKYGPTSADVVPFLNQLCLRYTVLLGDALEHQVIFHCFYTIGSISSS